MRKYAGDDRTIEQIREHYELEKQLANQLRNSNREERLLLYANVYDELYSRLPHHPRHRRSESPEQRTARIGIQLSVLRSFLKKEYVVVELGPGSCNTLRTVAGLVSRAVGVDVSVATTNREQFPSNLELMQFDGVHIPLPSESADLVYSMAVMEHLHPEDALEQLENVVRVLKPGGRYVFCTTHRFRGPDDISRHFDKVATGFHLHEYTFRELGMLLRKSGFQKVYGLPRFLGRYYQTPPLALLLVEALLAPLPYGVRHQLANARGISSILGVRAVAVKKYAGDDVNVGEIRY
jgi:SAM-dependent methyltransferase